MIWTTECVNPMPVSLPHDKPHGLASWPFGTVDPSPVPRALPDGRLLPAIAVVTLDPTGVDTMEATRASVVRQDYRFVRHIVVRLEKDESPDAALARALRDADEDYLLFLRPGDLLAPGALAAAGLAAVLHAADIVAGLRVVFDDTAVRSVDVVSFPPGRLMPVERATALRQFGSDSIPTAEFLVSRRAFDRAGGVAGLSTSPIANLWGRLSQIGATLTIIGRPILFHRSNISDHGPPDGATGWKRLRVAALSDRELRGGGAGIAQRRLLEAVQYGGHAVDFFTLAPTASAFASEWTNRFDALEAKIARGGYDLVLSGNIHNATRQVSVLARINCQTPVFAVTHDLFMITGRCTHPNGCTRIAQGCDELCPTPDRYPELEPHRIRAAFDEKQAFLSATPQPVLLANSHWTADTLRALAPPGAAIDTIDLAFPTQTFRPCERRRIRLELGLPEDAFLIAFAAVVADAPDKGTDDLLRTLRRLARPGIGFVAIGRIENPTALNLPNLFAPGPIADEARLAAWYGACDLFVTASRLETLGLTPIEAGLCGTPTVAYRVAGLTTAVIDGVSGRLSDLGSDALAATIEGMIDDRDACTTLGAFARIALESRNSHAAAYIGLHHVLVRRGVLRGSDACGRINFEPGILRNYTGSDMPDAPATGTVPAQHRGVALLRRAKRKIWRRETPVWMRRAIYLADRLRRMFASPRGTDNDSEGRRRDDETAARRLYVDETHLRGAVTGLERVTIELFAPRQMTPHDVRSVRSRNLAGMIATQLVGLPLRALFDRRSFLVFPGFPPAPLAMAFRERALVYVHDTFLLTRPLDLNWRARLYMRPMFAFAMRHGRHFFVNSATTARAVREICSPEATIALLRPPVRDVFGLADLAAPAPWLPGMPLRLVAIGTIEPRKNYPAAIAIVRALNEAGVTAELHVVGRVGWGEHSFLRNPPPFLKLHGYVGDVALKQIIAEFHLLLSTSSAEGLGLPLLEVQHGGLPVVAPGGEVFAEVLGDFGFVHRSFESDRRRRRDWSMGLGAGAHD